MDIKMSVAMFVGLIISAAVILLRVRHAELQPPATCLHCANRAPDATCRALPPQIVQDETEYAGVWPAVPDDGWCAAYTTTRAGCPPRHGGIKS